jgi:hypothetical protein
VSEPATELARRQHGDALSTILGTGDTRSALAQVEKNVRDIIEVCRNRGFITTFEQKDKRGNVVKTSEFYGVPAWQLLGMTYGVTAIVEWVKPIDGGYHARATAQTREGSIVGGAEALCLRKEPGKQYKSDHDLAAMAQARAQRNALRGALGAALVLAGFDFPDPEGAATNPQVGILHQLERELGWTHDVGHTEAGVDSYKDLTREQAAELIDRWQQLVNVDVETGEILDGPDGAAPIGERSPSGTTSTGSGSSLPESDSTSTTEPVEDFPQQAEADNPYGEGGAAPQPAREPEPYPGDELPATQDQWAIAARHKVSSAAVLRAVRAKHPDVLSGSAITKGQMAEALGSLL